MPNESGQFSGQRLESWKEIAAYLGKGVRTVIRWEKTEGLPVHRHQHESRASVFAYQAELDQWWKSRPGLTEAPPRRRRWLWLTIAAMALVIAGLALWFRQTWTETREILSVRVEPLTSYAGSQYSPSFSPDGSHFAFAWNGPERNNFDIYIQGLSLSEPRRLTTHPFIDYSPAWSSDGRWIAFLRRSPKYEVELYVVAVDGGVERKLTAIAIPLYQEATELSWSRDSGWLAYPDSPAEGHGLYLLNVETGERRRLTKASSCREHLDPSFSPDGRTLAFRCRNTEGLAEICVLALTPDLKPEREPEQVTRLGARSTSPVWTADGKGLFFSSGVNLSDANIYRTTIFPLGARSPEPRQVTTSSGEEYFSLATCPPAGLLASTRKRADINIWALVSNGGKWEAPSMVAGLCSTWNEMDPDFSPDGQQIAFASDRSGSMALWAAGSDGAHPRQMTVMDQRIVKGPRYSPDGRRIAFWTSGLGYYSIWLINASGGAPRELARNATYPSWSADGRWIYYSFGVEIYRISPDGSGSPMLVPGAKGWWPLESTDGRFLYFRSADAVCRIPLAGGATERILPVPANSIFLVRQNGLYIFDALSGGNTSRSARLKFHRFADGSNTELARLSARGMPGLAVSPDGRRILFCQEDSARHNLMLLRGAR